MADKGILNNRQGSVNFTITLNDGTKKEIFLQPGHNRLSAEQWEALQKNDHFKLYSTPSVREVDVLETDAEGAQKLTKQKVSERAALTPYDFPTSEEDEAAAKAEADAKAKAKADEQARLAAENAAREAAAKAEAEASAKKSK